MRVVKAAYGTHLYTQCLAQCVSHMYVFSKWLSLSEPNQVFFSLEPDIIQDIIIDEARNSKVIKQKKFIFCFQQENLCSSSDFSTLGFPPGYPGMLWVHSSCVSFLGFL